VFIASVRAYKSRLSTGDVAGADAQRAMIVEKFINAGELQVNLASWTVEETLARAASRDAHCFDAAADEICKLMSTDIWHKFIKSVEYLSLTAVERHSAYSTALVLRSGATQPAVSGCAANRQHKKVLLPPQQTIAPAHCSALHKAAAAAAAAASDVDDGNSSSSTSTSSTSTSSTSCASSRSSMISSSSMSALPSYSASGASSSSSRRGITSSSSMGKLTSYGTTATNISSGTSSKPLRRSSIDSPRPGAFTNGPFFGNSSTGDRYISSTGGCADRYNNNSSNNKWQKLQCEVEAVASGLKVLGAAQEHLAARSALLLD
jgi:Regulator of G protein signaling domain